MRAGTEREICVLGGGPAGSVIARRLAELGHEVVLIERAAGDERPRSESLAPSILPILDSVRLRRDVDTAVFCREQHAVLAWEPGLVQDKLFDDSPSLLIERPLLDEKLRSAAARSGVDVIAPARTRAAQRAAGGGWLVPVVGREGAGIIKSKFLVDARGKRHRMGIDDEASRTVALSAHWTLPAKDCAQTRIEAGADEWFWGSPLADGNYAAATFLDPRRVAGLCSEARTELHRDVLSRSQLLKHLLHGRMIGPVTVRDATPRAARDPIGSDFIRIGEASVAIDPLSSQGIQTALLSAIQGSAAVHTILTPGSDPVAAREFYRDRQRAAAASHRMAAARLYQASCRQTSFWTERSRAAPDAHADERPPGRASEMRSCVRLAQTLNVIEVPVLCGAFIRRAPALCHPRLKEPVAYFAGVPLAPLLEDVGGASTPDQIQQRWTRRIAPQAASSIMRWMWSVGILVAQAEPGSLHAAGIRAGPAGSFVSPEQNP